MDKFGLRHIGTVEVEGKLSDEGLQLFTHTFAPSPMSTFVAEFRGTHGAFVRWLHWLADEIAAGRHVPLGVNLDHSDDSDEYTMTLRFEKVKE